MAFGRPRSSQAVKDEDKEEDEDGAHKSEEVEKTKAVKAEDVDGDVEMNGNSEGADHATVEVSFPIESTPNPPVKRSNSDLKEDEEEDDEEPVRKRSRRGEPHEKSKQSAKKPLLKPHKEPSMTKDASSRPTKDKFTPNQSTTKTSKPSTAPNGVRSDKKHDSKEVRGSSKGAESTLEKIAQGNVVDDDDLDDAVSAAEDDETESEEEDKPGAAAKAREKVQSTLKSSEKDPYPDWKPGESVPYAALCTTFSLIEMTTKRLIISAHCSLFLRQVLRLSPQDLLPTVQLMINKLAADYAGIELGIGESLIMKAIGETTGRTLQIIKADQQEIGDLGLVAAKSRSNQPTMFKPKALTVRGVLDGLMGIATVSGEGSQSRKIAGIKKLLSAADAHHAGKGSKGIDITKDKGGASETKFIVRFLEGKLRLGLAERTVLPSLAHAMVIHEIEQNGNKVPSSEKLAEGEAILKTVYR